jgi:hypothetical protein
MTAVFLMLTGGLLLGLGFAMGYYFHARSTPSVVVPAKRTRVGGWNPGNMLKPTMDDLAPVTVRQQREARMVPNPRR